MKFIILNALQSAAVRGTYGEDHELNPIALANGTEWILPVAVIDEPAFSSVKETLEGYFQREVDLSTELPVPNIDLNLNL